MQNVFYEEQLVINYKYSLSCLLCHVFEEKMYSLTPANNNIIKQVAKLFYAMYGLN